MRNVWLNLMKSGMLKTWVQDIACLRLRYRTLNVELGIELKRVVWVEIELRGKWMVRRLIEAVVMEMIMMRQSCSLHFLSLPHPPNTCPDEFQPLAAFLEKASA